MRSEATKGHYNVHIGMPACRQKVTTMRPIIPLLFNVQHVLKPPTGKTATQGGKGVSPTHQANDGPMVEERGGAQIISVDVGGQGLGEPVRNLGENLPDTTP